MTEDFDSLLDAYCAHQQAGKRLDECLDQQPEHAEELLALLDLAGQIQAIPAPIERAGAIEEGRQRMLAAVRQQTTSTVRGVPLPIRWAMRTVAILKNMHFQSRLALRAGAAACVAFLLVGYLALAASASSLPGDALYPVKRSWERACFALTFQPESRVQLESQLGALHRREVQTLIQQGREATTDIEGALTLTADTWMIGELPIRLSPTTKIDGALADDVRVQAQIHVGKDGAIGADWIRVIRRNPQPGKSSPPGLQRRATAQPDLSATPAAGRDPDVRLAEPDATRPVPPQATRVDAQPSDTPTSMGMETQASSTPDPTRADAQIHGKPDATPGKDHSGSAGPQPRHKPSATPPARSKPTNTPHNNSQRP
jgi:hypothetical protein